MICERNFFVNNKPNLFPVGDLNESAQFFFPNLDGIILALNCAIKLLSRPINGSLACSFKNRLIVTDVVLTTS